MSYNGGKTWSADNRPLHTSGYSEAPNPYAIAHGFPAATGYTLTTNGSGDPIEASGPDGSIYAGGVLVHTHPRGSSTLQLHRPPGRDRGGFRSSNGGRTFGPSSAVLTDQDLQGMVNRGMNPEGNPERSGSTLRPTVDGRRPVDRCRVRIDHRSS